LWVSDDLPGLCESTSQILTPSSLMLSNCACKHVTSAVTCCRCCVQLSALTSASLNAPRW
jgi:hypothetical protein